MHILSEVIEHLLKILFSLVSVILIIYLISTLIAVLACRRKKAAVQARWHITDVHKSLTTLLGSGVINVTHFIMLPLFGRFMKTCFLCGSAMLIKRQAMVAMNGWETSTMLGFVHMLMLGVGQMDASLQDSVQGTAGNLWRIVISCGALVATLCAGFASGFGMKGAGKLILASYTIGFVMLFHVSNGIFRAVLHLPIDWVPPEKRGR